ncbi:formate--tetrahydrofolate ligase [Halococcus saccharolyticus]|uniref:Formate--tetrahydrofolate ligase n=1 Tax=Halococcus saccharolyticus DSM 5350 TaxID=1227455 RepID=M0MTV5_9EURY|nr:formate--tetrahydrofolate ligase [Halococcus saccharolyticus]EMA47895.1 Formate-tetrahydrofolate ligase [Halococcus saccharolyticus DSM 5350]
MASSNEDDGFPTDYEIAQSVDTDPITEVVEPLGLAADDLDLYGDDTAKLTFDAIERVRESDRDNGEMILVTGMTPTPMGEGKTVTTVGLSQAFNHIGEDALAAIREPSLGPVFGVKGGAAGGGYSQVLPMEDINLHFTGDLHALTSAHNLISTMLDNHIKQGNELDIAVNWVEWPRAIDMNDRVLRETVIGLGGDVTGVPREDGFILTAASELMAVLCLADDLADLKERVARIVVAYDEDGDPVTADDIEATGAVTILLKDALKPNIVQTIEGTPAFVHGGPFANIAHGTNSLIADDAARKLSDYLITEAGFGSDLGAEKFMNVVCRFGEMEPAAVTLVASIRALKYHGKDMWPADLDELEATDVEAVRGGFENLDTHVENLRKFGVPVVVALNRFPGDADEEVQAVLDHCRDDLGIEAAESTVFGEGGEGGADLARKLITAIDEDDEEFEYLYDVDDSIENKIETIATEIYGAESVTFQSSAQDDIERMESLGFDDVPVVMSKTFHSLSDTAEWKGAPTGWELEIQEIYPSAGAGFLVALTSDVLTLPGLPADPAAAEMDIDSDGTVSGLF